MTQIRKFVLYPGNIAQILPVDDNGSSQKIGCEKNIRINKTPINPISPIINPSLPTIANKARNIRFQANAYRPIQPNIRNISTPRGLISKIEQKSQKEIRPPSTSRPLVATKQQQKNEKAIRPPSESRSVAEAGQQSQKEKSAPRRSSSSRRSSIYVFMDRVSALPNLNPSSSNKNNFDATPIAMQLSNLTNRGIKDISANNHTINVITDENDLIIAETSVNEDRNSFVEFKKKEFSEKICILSISSGNDHTVICAKKENDFFVLGTGSNEKGQLGMGNNIQNTPTFKQIAFNLNIRFAQCYCGGFHTFLLSDTALVFAFGENNHGQLGLGGQSEAFVRDPTFCNVLKGIPVSNIAAGLNHSLALSMTGALYAAGRNDSGQLGITSQCDQRQFTLIDKLIAVFIVFITAKSNFSAAIDEFGSLYVWGGKWGTTPNVLSLDSNEGTRIVDVALGNDGRIAVLTAKNEMIVTGFFVNGQQISIPINISYPSSPFVKLYSGYEFFFAVTSNSKRLPLVQQANASIAKNNSETIRIKQSQTENKDRLRHQTPILALTASNFPEIFELPNADQIIFLAFSSVSIINASFLVENFKEDMAIAKSGVDIDAVIYVFRLLQTQNSIMKIVSENYNAVLEAMHKSPPIIRRPTSMRFLMIGLFHPSPLVYDKGFNFWGNLVIAIELLNAYSVLKEWVSSLTIEQLMIVLTSLKDFLTVILTKYEKLYLNINALSVKVLEIVWNAATRTKKLSFDMFYHEKLNQTINIKKDHKRYIENEWCYTKHSPWLLDADAKTKFLRENSLRNQQISSAEGVHVILGLFAIINPNEFYFLLNVDRNNLILDTFQTICLMKTPEVDLKKPLKVAFKNEPGVDGGGVQREFFELIVNQLLEPEKKLFVTNNDVYWFNKQSDDPSSLQAYLLTGIIVGLAIYNGNLINFRFPIAAYKKLKGQTVTFSDLEDFDPQLFTTLQNILKYDGDVENDMCITYEYEGVPLIPNGSDIPITRGNRDEYVEAVAKYIFDKSVIAQFNSFKEGFLQAAGEITLDLFRSEELGLLIAGREDLDFYALMKATKYENGYTEESPTVKTFWHIVLNRLTDEEKRKLLYFITSSPRAPIKGLGSIPFVIGRDGDKDHIPTSHTCFFMLVLPDEPDVEKMYQKLKIAIENSEGFAFK